jgi:hypothetical protein
MDILTDQERGQIAALTWRRYVALVRQLFCAPNVPTDQQMAEMVRAVLLASEQGETPHIDRGALHLAAAHGG